MPMPRQRPKGQSLMALRCKVTDEDYERVLRELALAEAPGKNEE